VSDEAKKTVDKKASGKKVSRSKLTLALNGVRLGNIAGSVCATVVMLICFRRDVEVLETVYRVVLTYSAVFVATFFLARVVLRTALTEFLLAEKENRARRREALKSSRETMQGAPEHLVALEPIETPEHPEDQE